MGEDDEVEPHLSTYKLPFSATAAAAAAEHLSGMVSPPLYASASVPFKWEEQPGKPRPCTDIIVRPEPARCQLELPPCRITKMTSPTTVLDGPDNLARPKFSSFRLFREKQRSFDSSSSCGGGSPQSQSYVDVLVGKKNNNGSRLKMTRLVGRSLRLTSGKKEADEGSFGFSPSPFAGFDSVSVEGKMRRNGRSFSNFSQAAAPAPLWVTVYESLKQAIPWKRTRKSKKEGAR